MPNWPKFSIHVATSPADLHMVSSASWEERKIGYGVVDECSPYEARDPTNVVYQASHPDI